MQRDMGLVRAILLAIEASPTGYAPDEINIAGYTHEQIGYHIFLMMDAGLVEGIDHTHFGSKSPEGLASRLTWAGHEFIDSARDESIWNKAVAKMKDVGGSVSIEVLKQILKSLVMHQIHLPSTG